MKLYIQVENGVPINHPALEENLLDALGDVPEHWEPFIRVPPPTVYLKKIASQQPEYQKIDGVWQDVWTLIDFSPEEKADEENYRKARWEKTPNYFNFSSWIFNEVTGEFDPPIPRPTNTDVNYRWCGAENNWKEAPIKPDDGNIYKFDFVNWQWILVE